jgi:hypothetical protein
VDLIQFARDFQSLGVAGVMALLGVVMLRYLRAEAERERAERSRVVEELRAALAARLADQQAWADRFLEVSVRHEGIAQKVTAAMEQQATAFRALTAREG